MSIFKNILLILTFLLVFLLGKREPEDDLETKVNLKKQKKNFENKVGFRGILLFLREY